MTCRRFIRRWRGCLPKNLPPAAHAHLSVCAACAAEVQSVSAAPTAQPMSNAGSTPAANELSRRGFIITSLAGLFAGLTLKIRRSFSSESPRASAVDVGPEAPVEYIVVGSGAGGGPLACNLAKAGHKVVLFEAGGDDGDDVAGVPFFNAFAVDDPRLRWDYFVRHYADTAQQQRDSKYIANEDGVWYPRVGSLGGCTVHSFVVAIYPSNSDWDNIAKITGDPSWSATNMRRYFERLEQCRYVQPLPGKANPSRHGFAGWQPTEIADPGVMEQDPIIVRLVRETAQGVARKVASVPFRIVKKLFRAELDPNDWRIQGHREGLYNYPLFTGDGRRVGPRELIRETAAALPNNLIIKTHCLVTRVLFDGTTAIGVEYLEGEHLYRADPQASPQGDEPEPRQTLLASREVILAAGAFNSPQILKLSGIGPADELNSHGIDVVVDLPGVGENLQDRYEVGVVTELNTDFTFAAACRPGQMDDPCFADWLQGQGVYTTPGGVFNIILKSATARAAHRLDPDLFIGLGPTRFKGYYPGYSVSDVAATTKQFTWVILKAHTRNRAGTVQLRSADPRDTPLINFRYFEEGSDTTGEDLAALVDSIEFVRSLNTRVADLTTFEVLPGSLVQTRDDIAQFVRDEAWGHHASCSNKMGPAADPMTVVDGDFRVHGTQRLRVVDASVFPRIPGYFILMPIYMISEKASDVILASVKPNQG